MTGGAGLTAPARGNPSHMAHITEPDAAPTTTATPASPERLLRIYLDDHWAELGGVLGLAERMVAGNPHPPWNVPITRLRDHLLDDDRTLSTIRDVLAIDSGTWKRRAAVAGERLGRLKPNGRLTTYSPLSRVYEIEMMTAHLVAARAMWQVLRRLDDPRLAGVELTGLELRTEVQLSALLELHTSAVDDAFRPCEAR